MTQRCLSSGEACNRDAERRTANIIQSDHVAELDAIGITTMLAADAKLDTWIGFAALLDGHAYQLAYAIAIQRLERIERQDFDLILHAGFFQPIDVFEQEFPFSIVAAITKSRLSKIVCTEAEEVSDGCDLIGG